MFILLAMTIAQLLAAAAENLAKTPTAMTETTHKNHLVRATNGGLAEFVQALPDTRRTEARVERLAAALAKVSSVTLGSTTLTFDPAWDSAEQADYFGRSLVVSGETGGYNQLVAANTLLMPWEGATNAAASISIRSDVVLLGGLEDCIEGEVVLVKSDRRQTLTFGRPPAEDGADVMRLLEGVPQYWWVEPLNGISAGASPLYVLRVFPQPDAVYSLHFRRRLWPTAIDTTMFSSTTEIPVLPHEEVHLVNLCQEALFSHPLWLGSAAKDQVREAVARARAWINGMTPNRGNTQPSRVRTKKGY